MNEFDISDKILNAELVSLLMTVSNRDLTFSKTILFCFGCTFG